tara:strand:- start:2796 stop:3599 length:804 start_codon:yes stop_codon:yes gene_type:complete
LSLGAFTSGCSSVFYQPNPILYVNPSKLPIVPEELDIPARDGHQIPAWYFKSPEKKSKGILIHFHGNAQNMSTHFMFLASAPTHGYDHLIFDYRGYGKSKGIPNPKNTVEDGVDVLKWVKKRFPDLPRIVFAQSLGGAVALKALSEAPTEVLPDALVIDSSFVSYRSAARYILGGHALTWLLQPLGWLIVDNSMAPDGQLKNLPSIPTLVIHGTDDSVISYSQGKKVFQQAPRPTQFWKVPQGRHTEFMARKKFRTEFYAFLDRLFL